ncbi:MAG: spore coat protein CotJB [Clostridia bacterium]|nr:spore coat protein CotJB [Clostridia bacterium]
MTEKEKLMKELSQAQFAAIETAMFLDTHPKDKKAREAMKLYREKFKNAKHRYEEKFGMIDIYSPNNDENKWSWVENPWPWEA